MKSCCAGTCAHLLKASVWALYPGTCSAEGCAMSWAVRLFLASFLKASSLGCRTNPPSQPPRRHCSKDHSTIGMHVNEPAQSTFTTRCCTCERASPLSSSVATYSAPQDGTAFPSTCQTRRGTQVFDTQMVPRTDVIELDRSQHMLTGHEVSTHGV